MALVAWRTVPLSLLVLDAHIHAHIHASSLSFPFLPVSLDLSFSLVFALMRSLRPSHRKMLRRLASSRINATPGRRQTANFQLYTRYIYANERARSVRLFSAHIYMGGGPMIAWATERIPAISHRAFSRHVECNASIFSSEGDAPVSTCSESERVPRAKKTSNFETFARAHIIVER